jgi:hypothetical protein
MIKNMTTTKYVPIVLLTAFALLASMLGFTIPVHAAVNFTPNSCYTAAATSSLAYMTPGTGTSTVSCNIGADGARSAVLAIQVNASSTATTFAFAVEESMNNIDWYPLTLNQVASSTSPFSITLRGTATLTFASSTIGQTALDASGNQLGALGTNNRNHYILELPTHMRYVRTIASVSTTTGAAPLNGAVWMHILPRQEIN